MIEIIGQLHREHFGQLVATTTRVTRNLELAEDVVQEAFAKAMDHWPRDGLPENPRAWLARTARNAAIDRFRKDRLHLDKLPELTHQTELEMASTYDPDLHPVLRDDMMRLIFTCCHPALNLDARVALCLKVVCGLETRQISQAFIVPEPTMFQRITRAKQKISKAGIGYHVPDVDELEERLRGVLAVIYLIFNEAYLPATEHGGVRLQLAEQAIRLARQLCLVLDRKLEAESLLALMLFQHSRRDTRFDSEGHLVLLGEQDRSKWDQANIFEATRLISDVFEKGGGASSYGIQAAIAAVHARAPSAEVTDWKEVCALYEALGKIDPSPVVTLNHAVAVAEIDGVDAGLEMLERLGESKAMRQYHLYHSARADMLRRIDRHDDAAAAYKEALELTDNPAEQHFLRSRLTQIR